MDYTDDRSRYGKASEEEPAGMSLSREIFLQCILHHGSKSFSHILNITERYLPLLHYVSSSDQAKFEVIRIVQKFWVKNRQMMMIVLDKFINYKILEPTTVVNWLFSPEGAFVDCNKYVDYINIVLHLPLLTPSQIVLLGHSLQNGSQSQYPRRSNQQTSGRTQTVREP